MTYRLPPASRQPGKPGAAIDGSAGDTLVSGSMRIARLPLILLPFVAIGIAALLGLAATMVHEAELRGAYQVWQENETFAAAAVALLAALHAARPVYLQVRAQSVQAALDLLHRIEADTEACIDARKRLFHVRRAAVNLAAAINGHAVSQGTATQELKDAIAEILTISPRDLRALGDRPTITTHDQMKIHSMSFVLSMAQQVAADIQAQARGDVIPTNVVERERAFLDTKLAGLFSLSSEIAEDLERQEDEMRARAQHLRNTADAF